MIVQISKKYKNLYSCMCTSYFIFVYFLPHADYYDLKTPSSLLCLDYRDANVVDMNLILLQFVLFAPCLHQNKKSTD